VVLFGSLQTGGATPHSDADLLVVLDETEHAEPRHRIPGILRAMAPLPCPVDLFVLTSEELDRARLTRDPVAVLALESGLDLL